MTTDNKTLADVQPGGRVRLGDQAERARFEAWAHAQSYRGGNIMADRDAVHPDVYADPIAQLTWKSWKAALSAQPSPGGQDALLGYVRVEAIKALREDDEVTGVMVHVEERTNSLPVYLAARQPVTMDDALAAGDGTLHGAIDHWQERALRAEAELAARQPMGDLAEPIFQIKHHADTKATWRDATEAAYEMQPTALRRIVYATPPAQAVDLGRARASIQSLLNWIDDWAETPEESGIDAIEAEAEAVLDLIDSQAVGNG